jgi:LPS sulfotransferase NodH
LSESETPSPTKALPRAGVEERARTRALRREARASKKALRQEERGRAPASGKYDSEIVGPKIEPAGKSGRAQALSHSAPPGGSACSIADPEQVAERLKIFTEANVKEVSRKLGEVRITPWPRLEGCLAILFTSRSGSTYLARELECAYDIGRLRESLRPPRVRSHAAAQIVESRQDAWFSFKAGGHSVIAAELCGFFDAYLPQTSFILLLRRDIVSQAVSCAKAKQTGQWHSTQKPKRAPVYDGVRIAQSISTIVSAAERLRLYAERSERPLRLLIYEDFAQGDFSQAMAACDALGVPLRRSGAQIRSMPVERISDATNEAWGARFREEMSASARDLVERYSTKI